RAPSLGAHRNQAADDQRRGEQPKRMKSDPPSRAPTSVDVFDERLRDVFSFRAAIPLLDEYLSSIQIDDDDPAFLFDWQEDNVNAFVAAANGPNAARVPPWLRTRPPNITASSFIDDVVYRLQPPLAGGRFGHIMLAPNNLQQYGAILVTLSSLQNDVFLQNAARVALPVVNNVEPHLAVTAHLTDSRVHNARPNVIPPTLRNGRPLRQLFI
ncbi:TPA: hypothetical protein N0F65_004693, partial [Lagenidium giganteum]